MMLDYTLFKTLHVLGAVVFVGNIVVTAAWKTLADRTRDARTIAFAQRLVTWTDFAFTGPGAAVVLGTGIALMHTYHDPWHVRWVVWGFGLFVASGVIWGAILVPLQIKQARLARAFGDDGAIPDAYWRYSKQWQAWGVLATVLPLVNVILMVYKPV